MSIKLKIPGRSKGSKKRSSSSKNFFADPLVKIGVAVFIIICTVFLSVFAYYYVKYDRIVQRRISGQLFNTAAKIYARPREVSVGEQIDSEKIVRILRAAGYRNKDKEGDSSIGTYRVFDEAVEIRPGQDSYHSTDGALIKVSKDKVAKITAVGNNDGASLEAYELEPQLVTALFEGEQRSKRQLVKFEDIPQVLVDAVLAIEDRRFFQHSGVNYLRLIEAAWIDLREGRHGQGGSTITMQVSRGFFLTAEKTIKRKLIEMLIAINLETKFTKQQIFELYANKVDLGQRGSFTIAGFAEASRSYFNKDIKSLTVPEAALLAGLVQRPSYLNPYRHPQRALDRRNLVLEAMVETGSITREQADKAKASPLTLAPPNVEASDAPYFVDLVKDQLTQRYPENELNEQAYRIYTTIDPDLQHAAAEAVEDGLKQVDEQVAKLRTRKKKIGTGKNAKTETIVLEGPMPQVALVAMDPHSGEILALVGGRNYGFSQLNHAVAKRPTGSIFKPFVFAAALNSAIDAESPDNVITPASLVDDSPSTFAYGEEIYEPRNYKNEYHGEVALKYALQQSLNNATVKLAETIGYDKVVALAKAAGINSVKATPAMALGAYDATPIDMAGAYTVFANQGVRVSPYMVRSLRAANGDMVEDFSTSKKAVLDPRVAYVMTTMMQAVVNNGTGYEVRARGFNAPAAGKTGTSHDAWFAGYTSNLLCIVWVGYDDYSDLRLSGGTTAAPIWAEFMKRAVKLSEYRDAKNFPQPPGVVDVQLDKVTNRLATPACPETYTIGFIEGTEPHETCEQSPDNRNFFQKMLGIGSAQQQVPVIGGQPIPMPSGPNAQQQPASGVPPAQQGNQQPAKQEKEKKKGFFGKIFGAFSGDDHEDKQQQQGNGNSGGNNSPPK